MPIRAAGEVDHFIPWARFPADLGHNLVLAHAKCNNQKSDALAAVIHLDAWTSRNAANATAMEGFFTDNHVSSDLQLAARIAAWAYSQTAEAGGQVWVKGRDFERLNQRWRGVLGLPFQASGGVVLHHEDRNPDES